MNGNYPDYFVIHGRFIKLLSLISNCSWLENQVGEDF